MNKKSRITLVLLLICLIYVPILAQNATLQNVLQTIEKGDMQRNKGNNEAALKIYLSAYPQISQFPDSSIAKIGFFNSLSVLFNSCGANEMALKYAKQAYTCELQKGIFTVNHYLRIGQIATFYLNMNQFDSAEIYFQKGLNLLKPIERKDTFFLIGAYNNLGMLNFQVQNFEKALDYYDTAFALVTNYHLEYKGIFASINDNLAELFMAQNKYEKGLEHCQIIEKWLLGKELEVNGRRPISVKLKEAECWWKMGKLDNAISVLASLKNSFTKPEFGQMEEQYYQLYVNIYKEKNQYGLAAEYQDKLIHCILTSREKRDQLTHKANEDISKIRFDFFEKELEYAQFKQNTIKKRTFFIVFFALLLILGGFLAYKRKIAWQQTQFLLIQNQKEIELKKEQLERENAEILLKQEQLERENTEFLLKKEQFERETMELQLKQEQMEKESIAASLEYRKKELSNTVNYLSDGREWNEKLLARLTKIENLKDKEKANLLRETIIDVRNRLSVDDKLNVVHENIEMLNQEFYAKMREKYPDISLTELELCAYFRMNLSNKDIAALRNTSLKAVQMGRYRIRKKLNIESEADIYAFLQMI